MVLVVAEALANLRDKMVFLGGSVVGFLLTNPSVVDVRSTDDVDVVVDVVSYSKYQDLLAELRKLGFAHDMHGPLCRLLVHGIKVDVMPTDESILSFTNRWYLLAMQKTNAFALSKDISINVISAPLFLCTKLEAFGDRGRGDYNASKDIEDIVLIVNGREQLLTECSQEEQTVKEFLSEHFSNIYNDNDFLNALPGLLPFAARNRESTVLSRIKSLSELAGTR
jgi:predicted nucleotidyltransferase